ncbi:unnamed protein product [Phyllotreta striolata]|uniref:Uncharacterized protein n=1 Tax=Phyllotreta striolata TaxID=444603 RepID=A0A9N9XKC5_PHYSR|nr:unnamed protein product [Phyllotreta striolata]
MLSSYNDNRAGEAQIDQHNESTIVATPNRQRRQKAFPEPGYAMPSHYIDCNGDVKYFTTNKGMFPTPSKTFAQNYNMLMQRNFQTHDAQRGAPTRPTPDGTWPQQQQQQQQQQRPQQQQQQRPQQQQQQQRQQNNFYNGPQTNQVNPTNLNYQSMM